KRLEVRLELRQAATNTVLLIRSLAEAVERDHEIVQPGVEERVANLLRVDVEVAVNAAPQPIAVCGGHARCVFLVQKRLAEIVEIDLQRFPIERQHAVERVE